MERMFSHLENGSQKYIGTADFYARFLLENQLKDRALWQKFVRVFSTREDGADEGWRGEYFGKMMRGACITYCYLPDEELYSLLEESVRALLATQDEEGRITTYPVDHELCGWDLWVRKYVLVGCLYFYDICRDPALKEEILAAMKRHADYILSKVGKDGISILSTSRWWGGINSSSLLEPIVALYEHTHEARYLAFAEYVISEGGCIGGDLLKIVEEGSTLPHDFPTTKAYETMSFFEGVLAYYEVTGEERMLSVVRTFAELVWENEVTVVGCAGCKSEIFNHAVSAQTEPVPDNAIMQETCVTVTWIRLLERLLLVTGEAKYADRIELSALNALYGAVNLYNVNQYCKEERRLLPGLPFDSYSPLIRHRRGVGIGGYKTFSDGGFYGCCACIGAAGTGLYPLASAMKGENGLVFNFFESGAIELDGFAVEENYDLERGDLTLTIKSAPETPFTLSLRVPSWSVDPSCTLCGETVEIKKDNYASFERVWQEGDRLSLSFHPTLFPVKINGKTAIRYGAYVMARDESKESGNIAKKIVLPKEGAVYLFEPTQEKESIRLNLKTKRKDIPLTDYASCGKHWLAPHSRISVWFDIKKSIFHLKKK